MRCPRCAAGLPPGATACARCGAAQLHAPWARPWERDPRRSASWRRIGLTVAVALLGVAVGLGIERGLGSGAELSGAAVATAPEQQSHAAALRQSAPTRGFADVWETTADGVGLVAVRTCDREGWSGSGFLVSPDRLVTALHVLDGAGEAEVTFDDRSVHAELARVDPANDLAVLRLDEAVPGHVFELAGGSPQPGTRVAAIGHPMGGDKALTVGTISGLDRDVRTSSGHYSGMLQTDTAINPGSSGGPVLDAAGRVVGVAGAVRTDAQGIGFAVPAERVRDLLARELRAGAALSCS